jgi:hypothetical protein
MQSEEERIYWRANLPVLGGMVAGSRRESLESLESLEDHWQVSGSRLGFGFAGLGLAWLFRLLLLLLLRLASH